MVIHIVNGFDREKPSFLQFIRKTKQLCGLVLTRKNQIRWSLARRPVKNATNRVIGNPMLRKSAIRNSKWARLDSNQGPRDYESPALTAELQALREFGELEHNQRA
jgi:hypothetical protein